MLPAIKKEVLSEAIIKCFNRHKKRYGRRRIRKDLQKQGVHVTEVRIAKVLKENRLSAIGGRKRKNRVKKTEEQYISENIFLRQFKIKEVNRIWCSDITEISVKGRKLYLCGIIDVCSKMILGWCLSKNLRQEIAINALDMAYGRFKTRKDLMLHTDRGCQFTSKAFKERLRKYGITPSMSRPGTPNDNQPIETFWKTLKQENPDLHNLGYEEAKNKIIEYIEMYYNTERLHSSLGYITPKEKMKLSVSSVHFS